MHTTSKCTGRCGLLALCASVLALLAPASASAAMGGANPEVASLTPNLRYATVTNVDPVNVTVTVQFCFDKPIGSLPTAGKLTVGTYRQNQRSADSASRASDTRCADAVFSSMPLDSKQLTYVHVLAGAVIDQSNGKPNLADSAPVTGSETHTGTAGHTPGPDLDGITVNNGTATVNYVFDQNVTAPAAGANVWQLEDVNGTLIPNSGAATDVSFAGNVVSVKFPPGSTSTAVRGVVAPFAVQSLADNSGTFAVQSAARPGNSGNTNLPDPISASLGSNASGVYIDIVFDETLASIDSTGFILVDSTGAGTFDVSAADYTIVNGNTVRWQPTGAFFDRYNEYMVQVSVQRNAVTAAAAPAGRQNTEGALPLGGNAGAFAWGFTTGPEALRVTFDNTAGVAKVLLDQRFISATNANFHLIDDTGTVLPASPISVSGAGGPAGQVTATVTFTPAEVSGARSLQMLGGAVTTGHPFAQSNVDQVLSPTASAAVLSRPHARWRHARTFKRVNPRHQRRIVVPKRHK